MTRYSALRPVHRIKHVVDSDGALVAGTKSTVDLIASKDAPVLAQVNQVQTGSKVNGIYLHVEVSHTSGAGRPQVYMMIMKNPGNALSIPEPNAVGSNDNKRFIIHQEMIMMSGDAGNGLPRPIFNGVIKIPKGYIRQGPDDRLQCVLLSPNVAVDWCLQSHYKEFR